MGTYVIGFAVFCGGGDVSCARAGGGEGAFDFSRNDKLNVRRDIITVVRVVINCVVQVP